MIKQQREENPRYLDFIRKQPCVICGLSPCDPHHTKRVSQRGSDMSAIPLCRKHHTELHATGVLSFAKRFSIDYESIVARLHDMFDRMPENK